MAKLWRTLTMFSQKPHAQTARRILCLALLAMTVGFGAAMRNLVSPLQESIRLDLGLSDAQMGLIQGVAVSLPITVLSAPFGRLIDRRNRVHLLWCLSASWTAGTFLAAMAHSFTVLFLSRMLIGFGLYCAIPTAISLAADLSSRAWRGRAIFPLMVGDVLGAAAAFALGGAMLTALSRTGLAHLAGMPWREVHLLFGIASLIGMLSLLGLREPTRLETRTTEQMGLRESIGQLWVYRRLLVPLCIGQLGVIMAGTAAGIWSAPLLARHYGLDAGRIGSWMGWVMLITGLAGAVLGGVLADAGYRYGRSQGVLRWAVAASALALPVSFFAVMPGAAGFILMLAVLLLAGTIACVLTSTAVALVIPNELRGMSFIVLGVLNGLAGFGVTPTLVPLLAQGRHDLGPALTVVTLVVNGVSLMGYVWAMRRLTGPHPLAAALPSLSQCDVE
jgi:predicted MFS family arabinose efflux permease